MTSSFNKATNINFVDISLLLLSRLGLCKNHSENKTVSFQHWIIVELKFDTSHLSEITLFRIHLLQNSPSSPGFIKTGSRQIYLWGAFSNFKAAARKLCEDWKAAQRLLDQLQHSAVHKSRFFTLSGKRILRWHVRDPPSMSQFTTFKYVAQPFIIQNIEPKIQNVDTT